MEGVRLVVVPLGLFVDGVAYLVIFLQILELPQETIFEVSIRQFQIIAFQQLNHLGVLFNYQLLRIGLRLFGHCEMLVI